MAMYGSGGALVCTYSYDSWGKLLSIKNAAGTEVTNSGGIYEVNPILYRGYYYDAETGFYYVSSRYYDPETCRFINADDTAFLGATGTVLSCNLFAYCENNPVMDIEPNGYFSIPSWTISVAIDAIILTLAGWLKATWMGFMAPLKAMGKRAAAKYFARNMHEELVEYQTNWFL